MGATMNTTGSAAVAFATSYIPVGPNPVRTDMHLYKSARAGASAAEDRLVDIGWGRIASDPALHRRWDLVTAVTSTRNPSRPELARIAKHWAGRLGSAHETVLRVGPGRIGRGTFDPDAYIAPRGLAGQDVLLVEDTWVTGAHALAAASALEQQGAQVTILSIARRAESAA